MPNTHPTRVLLVEDDYDVRHAVARILTVMEFSVTCAVNGQEGVARALEMQPDVILMDVRMPVMDGIEATCRIRQHAATAHVPVVILSAFTDAKTRAACAAAGATAFLSKPVGFARLVETIHHWTAAGRHHPAGPEAEPASP